MDDRVDGLPPRRRDIRILVISPEIRHIAVHGEQCLISGIPEHFHFSEIRQLWYFFSCAVAWGFGRPVIRHTDECQVPKRPCTVVEKHSELRRSGRESNPVNLEPFKRGARYDAMEGRHQVDRQARPLVGECAKDKRLYAGKPPQHRMERGIVRKL